MFCAFDGPPKIIRLHGTGRVVLAGELKFEELRGQFAKERTHGQRSIIVVDVDRIASSGGFSVPLMDFREHRDILDREQLRRKRGYFEEYWRKKNARSIDGLPGVETRSVVD